MNIRTPLRFAVVLLAFLVSLPLLAAEKDRTARTTTPVISQPVMEREIFRDEITEAAVELASKLPAVFPSIPREMMVPIAAGTYEIGVGGAYTMLRDAVADLQTNGIDGLGPVIFEFKDTLYTDTAQTIGGYLNQGTQPVTFRPKAGVVTRILITGGTSTFGIRLDSAANVTWDGSNSGGSDRSLTLDCDTIATPTNRNNFLIRRGSKDITLKNMIIRGTRRAANNGTTVVLSSNGVATAPRQENISILNNHIMRGGAGIAAFGVNGSKLDSNIVIMGNLIGGGVGAPTLDCIAQTGVNLSQVANARVEKNDINGIRSSGLTLFGLFVTGGVKDFEFKKNTVHNMVIESGAVRPIALLISNNPTTGPSVLTKGIIANNMMYDIHNFGLGVAGRAVEGVIYNPTASTNGNGTGNGTDVEYINNTFYFNLNAGEGGLLTAFLFDGNFMGAGTASGNVDAALLRNNIFATRRIDGFTRMFLIFSEGFAGNLVLDSDNNLFHEVDGGAFGQYPTPWPAGPSTVNALFSDWQTITGNDLSSVNGDDPLFVSATDPHISTALGDVSPANNVGVSYPGIVDDIDDEPRSITTPDIGADEFTPNLATDDIRAFSLDTPSNGALYKENEAFTPVATFRNPGTANQTSVPVRYEIVNTSNVVVWFDATTIPSITSGTNEQVTFATVSGGLADGSYTIRAIALLPGDQIPANDTLSGSITVLPVISTFPYTESFEDPGPEAIGGFGWASGAITGAVNDWVIGTPAKTQIAGAFSGTKAFVTRTTGAYTANQNSFIAPPIMDMSSLTGDVRVEWWQNFDIEFAWDAGVFEMSTDGGATWVRVDSTLGTGPTFNTASSTGWYNTPVDSGSFGVPYWSGKTTSYAGHLSGWIKSTTRISGIAGLSDVRFRWRFMTDGFVQFEGWAIDDVSIFEDNATVNVATSTGWDLVSNPVVTPNNGAQQLFPASVFDYGFAFNTTTGYVQESSLANGKGYWVKLASGGVNPISGSALAAVSVPVFTGWNLVGSLSFDLDAASVMTSPGGIIVSDFFGYTGSYVSSSTLEAGRGYWVKVNANGSMLLKLGESASPRAAAPVAELNSIVITDANGNSQTLSFGAEGVARIVEMPPVPPVGAFDARFITEDAGYMIRTHAAGATSLDMPIAVQATAYPLTISWNIIDGEADERAYMLNDATGSPLRKLSGTGSLQVTNPSQNRFSIGVSGGREIPAEFALMQNYPNPFNPSTTIRFALPTESRVNVEVYNLLGQRVGTLLNDLREAGYHSIEWNGTGSTGQQLGSGVYFVKFSADNGQGRTFSGVRKVMMMK